MDLSVVPYNKQSNMKTDNESEDGDIVEPHNKTHHHNNNKKLLVVAGADAAVKYRECMRNHAASIGGHANDGCGEFMPADAPPLTCAACGCHRNFHRRDPHARAGGGGGHYPVILYNPPPAPGPATPRWERHASYERRSSETPERDEAATAVITGSGGGGASGKRFRTKFTAEQKERMLAFAESIGWRIQRQDDMAINQFCADIGVRRNVLKVWMHNNKNAHRRRDGVDVAVQHQHQPPMVAHSAAVVPNPQAIGV